MIFGWSGTTHKHVGANTHIINEKLRILGPIWGPIVASLGGSLGGLGQVEASLDGLGPTLGPVVASLGSSLGSLELHTGM